MTTKQSPGFKARQPISTTSRVPDKEGQLVTLVGNLVLQKRDQTAIVCFSMGPSRQKWLVVEIHVKSARALSL